MKDLNEEQKLKALAELQLMPDYKKVIDLLEERVEALEKDILNGKEGYSNESVYCDEDLVKWKRHIWQDLKNIKVSQEVLDSEGWKIIQQVVKNVVDMPKEYQPDQLYENLASQILNNFYNKEEKGSIADRDRVERSVYIDFIGILPKLIHQFSPKKAESDLDPYQYEDKK